MELRSIHAGGGLGRNGQPTHMTLLGGAMRRGQVGQNGLGDNISTGARLREAANRLFRGHQLQMVPTHRHACRPKQFEPLRQADYILHPPSGRDLLRHSKPQPGHAKAPQSVGIRTGPLTVGCPKQQVWGLLISISGAQSCRRTTGWPATNTQGINSAAISHFPVGDQADLLCCACPSEGTSPSLFRDEC